MLHIIGLGLGGCKDITVKGLELVKSSDLVYLESYTSLLQCSTQDLEEFYGKKILLADRTTVESDDNQIVENAKTKEVALLVIGDPMSATTHIDLYTRAKELGVECSVTHNASVLTAVGMTGLQLYKFGKTTSIPFENEQVDTPYTVLKSNQESGLHTLFLLDLRPLESRFMTVNQAIEYLLNKEKEKNEHLISETTLAVGVARLGSDTQVIQSGTLKELQTFDFGGPVHSLIIPGKLHFMEEDALNAWK